MTAECSYSKKKKKKGFISTWVWSTRDWPHSRGWMFLANFCNNTSEALQKRCNNYLLILFHPKRISSILETASTSAKANLGSSRFLLKVTEVADCGKSILGLALPLDDFFKFSISSTYIDLPAPFASPLSVSARAAYYPIVPMRILWTWQCLRIPGGLKRRTRKSFLFASTWFSLYLYSCYDWRWSVMKVAGLSIQWVVGRLNWPRSVGWQSLISTRSRAFR